MTKGRLLRQIDAYLDGALAPRERQELEGLASREAAVERLVAQRRALACAVRTAWLDGPCAPSPDQLLRTLRPQLARVDAEVAVTRGWGFEHLRGLLGPLRVPALVGTAAAFVFYALVSAPLQSDPITPGSASVAPTSFADDAAATVYELDNDDESVLVFEGGGGATIIWVVDEPDGISQRAPTHGLALEGWA